MTKEFFLIKDKEKLNNLNKIIQKDLGFVIIDNKIYDLFSIEKYELQKNIENLNILSKSKFTKLGNIYYKDDTKSTV